MYARPRRYTFNKVSMKTSVRIAWLLILGSVSLVADDFQTVVQPILRANCSSCHDDATRTSGFSAVSLQGVLAGGARRGAAVIAGKPEESPLAQMLRGQIKPQMPMGKSLPPAQIAAIEKWI